MSQENVELVRAVYALGSKGLETDPADWDRAFREYLDEKLLDPGPLLPEAPYLGDLQIGQAAHFSATAAAAGSWVAQASQAGHPKLGDVASVTGSSVIVRPPDLESPRSSQ